MNKLMWYLLELLIGFAILIAFIKVVLFLGENIDEKIAMFILLIPVAMVSFRIGERLIEFTKDKLNKER